MVCARAWWAHQWFGTLLYWKLIIQKYFSIFKIDKNAFQLKNKLTDMRAFFSYFTWRKKKVMQHYFWNWLAHNFCHTLERWGRYYRMGSFKIFAEVVRFFFFESKCHLCFFIPQRNQRNLHWLLEFQKTNLQIEKSYGDFLFPKEFRLTKSWKSLICKWVVKGRRIWQHLTVLAIQPPLPRSMILKSIKQKKNN